MIKPEQPHALQLVVEAIRREDFDRMADALELLAEKSRSLGGSIRRESGQLILTGDSEEELEAEAGWLHRQLDLDVCVGPCQVAYRATLSEHVEVKYTHSKVLRSAGEFAGVTIAFGPLPPGSGFVFENRLIGWTLSAELITAIEEGLKAEKESGLLAGFPVIDFAASLVDATYHEVDSNASTFEIAARAALRELEKKHVVKVLEPVMKVKVIVPGAYLGAVIGDLNSRGHILDLKSRDSAQILTAMAPANAILGYTRSLKRLTDGRAYHTSEFDHYEVASNYPSNGGDTPFPAAAAMRVA